MWVTNAKHLFLADPYFYHLLEKNDELRNYETIQVAKSQRATMQEFLRDHEFVDDKFRKYTHLLASRLNKAHGLAYDELFWRKALSLSLLRHVTFCYNLFQACETNFSPYLHDCNILAPTSYYIPEDFDEHRRVFQHTDLGQEQLFSVYCGLFYSGQFKLRQVNPTLPAPIVTQTERHSGRWRRITPRKLARRFMCFRDPTVGILNAFFSLENLDRLLFQSKGRIQTVTLPAIPASTSVIRWDMREQLVCEEPDFDRFDRFVFACLLHGLPKIFVEDFKLVCDQLNNHFNRYKSLRWIVSEAWIGHNLSALALAILQQRDVKHIYNEHNYLSYFFLGTNLKYLAPLVDEFVSLGWEDSSTPNLVRGASLFQWVDKEAVRDKEHEILFVLSVPIMYVPEINAAYGESGAYCAQKYLDMNQRFLGRLGEETLGKIYVRSYPLRVMRDWLTWDQAFVLAPYLSKVKVYDDNSAISGQSLIQRSRLVIANYLSTTYLESIIANVPTIFILNKDAYLLTEKYMEFFDALIDVGVCQTNPEEAADFVNRIKDDPEQWWGSSPVQNARAVFLNANIGNPEIMIQHLLEKAN